jgi:hypothetical protein
VGAFDELSKAATDGDIATADNFEDVNAAFEVYAGHIEALRAHVQHEIDMQVISTTSPMGWLAVEQLEIGLRDLSIVTVSSETVRKAEKERMAYDKDLRAASAAKAPSSKASSSSKAKRSSRSADKDRDYASSARDGRDGREGKRAAGGGKVKGSIKCYKCGVLGHKADTCSGSKPYSV